MERESIQSRKSSERWNFQIRSAVDSRESAVVVEQKEALQPEVVVTPGLLVVPQPVLVATPRLVVA